MRSTDRRRGERGASLIESVVAAALMGIGVVGGLTAWDTAVTSATKAMRIAWANCIVRSEMDAILSAQYDRSGYAVPAPFDTDGTVTVSVSTVRGAGTAGEEQQVTVRASDPSDRSSMLAHVSALKAMALTGGKSMDSGVLSDVMLGCPPR